MKYMLEYEEENINTGVLIHLKNNYLIKKKVSELVSFLFENKNKIKSYKIYEIKEFDSEDGFSFTGSHPNNITITA